MFLMETNIQSEAYPGNQMGHNMTCLATIPSSARGAQGGVCMVTRECSNGWGIESTRFHRTNVVSCEIVSGHTRTPLVGAYLPSSTLEHLPDGDTAAI